MAIERIGYRLEAFGKEDGVRAAREVGDAFDRELSRIPPAAARAGQSLLGLERQATASGARMRGALGQVGYQINDIAVQLQAGQNPLTVLIQQGGQIAGAWGPNAAIFATIATVAAIAGNALFGMGDKTDHAKAASDALKASQDAMQGSMTATARSADEVAAAYRRATAEARALEAATLDVAITRGRESLKEQRSGLIGDLGDVALGIVGDRRRADTIRSLMERNQELGFPPEELAADLQRDIDLVRRADAELKAIAGEGDPSQHVLRLREILGLSPEALDDTRRAADDAVAKAKKMADDLRAIKESEARRRVLGGTDTEQDRKLLDQLGRSPGAVAVRSPPPAEPERPGTGSTRASRRSTPPPRRRPSASRPSSASSKASSWISAATATPSWPS